VCVCGEQLSDQSHIVGAETSVYDFECEVDTAAYSASNQQVSPPAARWVEGYSALSSSASVPYGSGLKLRVSNRPQSVGLVTNASL